MLPVPARTASWNGLIQSGSVNEWGICHPSLPEVKLVHCFVINIGRDGLNIARRVPVGFLLVSNKVL